MLILNRRDSHPIPLEADCIRPDTMASLDAWSISNLPVWHGNISARLGDYFDIIGNASDGDVVVRGDCSRVKHLGCGMTAGTLRVESSVGMHAGADMRGGLLRVEGDADDWLGAEMHGGQIIVAGNAGNSVGSAYLGANRGMRGGEILVSGNAGNEVGATLRRGLIVIGGDVGNFPGINLLAGTLIVLGTCGVRPGAAMRRGSILLPHYTPELLCTFAPAGPLDSVFPELYFRHLQRMVTKAGIPGLTRQPWPQMHRHAGDLASLGKGEILCPA
ncbi:MAG: formylmethanofuran dehydrogenase subunit C [Planctomycetota bacterium]|nr:formylmethanofuran dehydrogenase subunit C [Planctomycetota bacterium]